MGGHFWLIWFDDQSGECGDEGDDVAKVRGEVVTTQGKVAELVIAASGLFVCPEQVHTSVTSDVEGAVDWAEGDLVAGLEFGRLTVDLGNETHGFLRVGQHLIMD